MQGRGECLQKFNSFNPITESLIILLLFEPNIHENFFIQFKTLACERLLEFRKRMEKTSNELNEKQLVEKTPEIFSHSFSYDGYEQLHDDAMDKISVSILYSDYEETVNRSSRNNLTTMNVNQEKKMKISLSQEQLKLNPGHKNFLSVPSSAGKGRAASFTNIGEGNKSVKIDFKTPIVIEAEANPEAEAPSTSNANQTITVTPPRTTTFNENVDEIVYAVPRRFSPLNEKNEIKTSRASLSTWKSASVTQTSSTAELNKNFKYPLSFYCKICNNVLSDPRTLDCLHTFCMQCLARLDASNDLQNNQFWRKISEHSDASCEYFNHIVEYL